VLLKYLKLTATYGMILVAGLVIGWGVPRAYERFKPAYSEGDFSAYYAGTNTNVVVYGTPTCPYCTKARAYLREHRIPFADLDVTTSDKAKRDFAKLGSRAVPVILVGSRRIDGFNSAAIQDALEAAGHHIPH
jgi:mycoredoxin